MKRNYAFLMTAFMLLVMFAIPMGMRGQATVGTTLWEETWTGGEANETPSAYGFEGTTVYGGTTLTYAQSSTNTKLYEEALAGGESPELLLSKNNQTWTISNIPTGQATGMALTFKSNKTTFDVTSTTTGITISGSQKSWTIATTSSVTTFNLTIKNTGSSNARIDDIVLSVTTAGGDTPQPTTYTVTFDAGDGTFVGNSDFPNASNSVTAGTYTLPSATPATGYTFDGWAMGETTYQAGASYTVSGNADFVASYTENTTPTPGGTTATLNIQAYAEANSWTNGTQYTTATVAPVTFTANGGGNTGKYYESGHDWRFYQGESASITITVPEGYTLVSVTPTYSVSNGGVLKNGNATIASGTTVNVSGTSVTFTVGNSGSATNGQVRFTNIDVVYVSDGGTQTASDLAITNESTTLTFDLYNNTTAQVISYTTSSTGAITITPPESDYFSYVHDAAAKTITVTPTAVTPSAQTVTISQAADDDYYAGTATFTVSVVNSTPLDNIAELTALTENGNYNVALSDAVVTYVNGNYAYIKDASGAIVMYKDGHGFTAGDVLNGTATVAYQVRNGNPQITNLTGITPVSGTAPDPTEIAASVWNYTFNNVLSQYFKITGATITQNNNKYYISLNNESIQLYKVGTAISGLDLTKTYSITGFPTLYNSTKELQIFDNPEVETATTPTVTVTPNSINAPFAGAEGTLALTYENIENFISFDYSFCDANGGELEGNDPDWIYAEINDENDAYTLDYIIDANQGEARTAYIKVYTFDDNLEEVYAIVTVNQAQYVVDYATLPFNWEGGASADFMAQNGVTANGLGSDYAASNAPYLIKFDNTGDYIQVKCDQQPGKVTIGVKMIGGSTTSTITIQGSADGETFTNVEELTISGAQNDVLTLETTNAFAANVRYVRMLFTKGSNVGVGPITIAVVSNEASITVNPDEVNVDAEEHDGTLDLTYENLTITEMSDFDIQFCDANGDELSEEPDWIEVLVAEQDPEIGEGYVVSYYMVENEGPDARTAYFKVYAMDDETNLVYSNLVTISQAAPVAPVTGDKYVKVTSTADLTSGQYLIVYEDGGLAFDGSLETLDASSNTIEVTINDSEIDVDNITIASEFTIDMTAGTIMSASGYYIGRTENSNGMNTSATEAYTNTISIDDNGNAVVVASDGAYLRYNATSGQDRFRYFKSSSYTNQKAIQLYKKVESTPTYTLTIDGYNHGDKGGYYLIASPVTVDPSTIEGMTVNPFDLYYFDESKEDEWRNYEANTFNLVPGKGYLYAKEASTIGETFSFELSGTAYNGDPIILQKTDNAQFEGWNLVGNPLNEAIYIDRDFYVMNEGLELIQGSGAIEPMQGFFVTADTDEEELSFSTTAPSQNDKKIVISVSNGKRSVIDRATVRFDQGRQLPKFMLNDDNTKLYIPDGNEDYAVVRRTKSGNLPVNFEPAEDGEYNINVNPESLKVTYLHLIDNKENVDIDLLSMPTYRFKAEANEKPNRFELIYKTGQSSYKEVKPRGGKNDFSFYNNGNLIIENEGESTLQVIDINGRILSNEKINGSHSKNIDAVPGIYTIRLINSNDVMTQKIVVK